MAYNILIIDDSNVVRKVIKKVFEMTGLTIGSFYEAGNGQEGLKLLREQWVDLVLLDINMPVMNGIQFLKKVREDDTLKDTKVAIISTEGSKDRIQELNELGIEDYLRKPVTPESLVTSLTKILGEHRDE